MHRFREEMSKRELDNLRKEMESSMTISTMEIQEEKYQKKEAELQLVGAQDAELDIFARQAINEGRARRAELLRRIDEV
jgi:hypothetical protein